ncbi:MAG: hypothetical protein NXH81_06835 [Halieaceae bacterium]|uniref:hypothetical protein n=1 Tax=Haliea alexandrii TaxID=2448162 RepID=UPI000F0B80F4|nr:hypothetical protein [Haliea alexandrii]MCR9185092.1 hypothetical protein [Halieaceae bacterium]
MNTPISNREFLQALGLALTSIAASAALLLPAYLLLVPVLHPEFKPYIDQQKADAITIPGNLFRPVVFGDGGLEGSVAVISELAEIAPEDHAVLVHRRLFQADQFPFLRYHIEGRNPALRIMLFWQRADTPGENHFAELDYSGDGPQLHNLLRNEEWRGTITELAVGFFGDLRGGTVKLHRVELMPYSHSGILRTVWAEWTAFAPWDQRSINAYRGVPSGALMYPVPAIAIWLATSMIVILLLRQFTRRDNQSSPLWLPAILATGLAWAFLDGLWLQQLFRQNTETRHLFAGKALHEKKLADWDGEYYAAAHVIKQQLAISDAIVSIYRDREQRAFAERLRFHLLPEVKTSILPTITPWLAHKANEEFDHVIILTGPESTVQTDAEVQRVLTNQNTARWERVLGDGPVALYATHRKAGKATHD